MAPRTLPGDRIRSAVKSARLAGRGATVARGLDSLARSASNVQISLKCRSTYENRPQIYRSASNVQILIDRSISKQEIKDLWHI